MLTLAGFPPDRGLMMGLVLSAVLGDGSVGDLAVVVATGALDVESAPRLREQFVELVGAGRHHLVVDVDGLDFLDSTGLGVLVAAVRRVRPHGGSLRLVCRRQRILGALAVVGPTKLLPVYPSLAAAVVAEISSSASPQPAGGVAERADAAPPAGPDRRQPARRRRGAAVDHLLTGSDTAQLRDRASQLLVPPAPEYPPRPTRRAGLWRRRQEPAC